MCKNIHTVGSIHKEDELKVLNFSVIENTLVLETFNPFPGYHSEIIEKGKPKTVYFIIKHRINREYVSRLFKDLSHKLNFYFHFTVSEIIINNQKLNAIRVNKIMNYNDVYELQKALAKEYVPFVTGKIKGGKAIIKTLKLFNLDEVEENVFKNKKNPDFSYFIVPNKLAWDDFKDTTLKIRHSWELINFDAAQAIFYLYGNIHDAVRIYTKDASLDDLKEIREKYLAKIK